jgi:hypothetical protein
MSYGSTGAGTDDHLALVLFKQAAGVSLDHVPFLGGMQLAVPGLEDLLIAGAVGYPGIAIKPLPALGRIGKDYGAVPRAQDLSRHPLPTASIAAGPTPERPGADPENVRIGFRSRLWSAPRRRTATHHSNLEVLEWIMNTAYLGNPLIGELLADPAAFQERGRAYQLLEEYFAGLPVQTLRPLLQHTDTLVKYAAVWSLRNWVSRPQPSSMISFHWPIVMTGFLVITRSRLQ